MTELRSGMVAQLGFLKGELIDVSRIDHLEEQPQVISDELVFAVVGIEFHCFHVGYELQRRF
jgi:hypothetical protein